MRRELNIMQEYKYLLSGVQKKMVSNGLTNDIMQRLENFTTVFNNNSSNKNIDSFNLSMPDIQYHAMNIFKNSNANDINSLNEMCNQAGITMNINSVETAYATDQTGNKNLSIYTFTDEKGNEFSIADINVKEVLYKEELCFDDLLKDVIQELANGDISLPETPYQQEQAAA